MKTKKTSKIKKIKNLNTTNVCPGYREISPTTIPNACPECGGDVHDGTGTGWYVCKKCHYMY